MSNLIILFKKKGMNSNMSKIEDNLSEDIIHLLETRLTKEEYEIVKRAIEKSIDKAVGVIIDAMNNMFGKSNCNY